jgi:pyridoxamine 5'-phosphate oxidase
MEPDTSARTTLNDPPELDSLLETAWEAARAGVRESRHGWHQASIASNGPGGMPEVRTVVLRSVDSETRSLGFHTDARSGKIEQFETDDRVGLLLYDRDQRIQLRGRGKATVHRDDAFADAAWAASSLSSRRCYLAPHAPSSVLPVFSPNLPGDLLHHIPDEATSEAGREHFALVRCQLDLLEWLHLRHDGHVRARFQWDGVGDCTACWLAP